jgi:iron complex transport system ATP-binding protein
MSGVLTVQGLSASYGEVRVLSEVALQPLQPGQVTALIGPNAAGKSTLLKAIAGLVRTVGATIRLNGVDIAALPLRRRAQLVRFVPQAYATQARLSVFELLLVARMCGGGGSPDSTDLKAVERALDQTGLGPLSRRMAGNLSGGQQQLVALAQALTRPAPVLLLDEPTSALDLRNQLEAMAIMRRVAVDENAIVVAALHDLNLAARHADRIVLMGLGRIVADGSPADVLTTERCGPVYAVELASGLTSRGSLAIEAYLPNGTPS